MSIAPHHLLLCIFVLSGSDSMTTLCSNVLCFCQLQSNNSQEQADGHNVPKAYVFSTFFWTRLACFGSNFDYAGAGVYLQHPLQLVPLC